MLGTRSECRGRMFFNMDMIGRMVMAIKLIIFDLDGTLVDSIDGLATSMNKVLASRGYPQHRVEDYKRFVGNGIKKLVSRGLPEDLRDPETVDMCYDNMLKAYHEHYAVGMSIYKGIDAVLNELTAKGVILAINTNKNQVMAQKVVDLFLSQWNFVKIIGADANYEIKPSPAAAIHIANEVGVKPSECIYIGDSEVDLNTAKNAGMHSILVTWGFRTEEELLAHKPEVLIKAPSEIMRYIG
ncbi:MAG: HAD family hydrolase [Firmicutes bacterium HGW-Firmicutes-7]|nr:MAG: HAD family hydrolase [Firmicutes bacterium HGW-Firmicutes-7]